MSTRSTPRHAAPGLFCLALGLALLCAAPTAWARKPKAPSNEPARAACAEALAKGDLDALRIAWTWWPDRSTSQTVEIKKGRLARFGGMLKGSRSERPLTDAEKKELLDALRAARVDKLVWIDRDVKNEQDRVLNIDVVDAHRAGGALQPVGAFVRTGGTWRSGATTALADLLEKWLAPNTSH